MVRTDRGSWGIRDSHMMGTGDRLAGRLGRTGGGSSGRTTPTSATRARTAMGLPHRARSWLAHRAGHRAIGVVYDPASESGDYVPTSMGERYDALL